MSIVLLGEAWGADEETLGHPFVGVSGGILISMLEDAGLLTLSASDKANKREYWKTRNPYFNLQIWEAHPELRLMNVFNLRPPRSNDVANLCGPKDEGLPDKPALMKGKFVRKEYANELVRLYHDLETEKPNVVVALGATAAWALLGTTGIRNIRGAATVGRGLKIIPTYHPAAVSRDWSLRPIVLSDLSKAKEQMAFPELRRPEREIWVDPTYEDLLEFERLHMPPTRRLSVDIETIGDQINCIGFAPSRSLALVVPIFNKETGESYWPTLEEEFRVWRWIKRICESRRMFGQNFLYDMHFLWKRYGIACRRAEDDTMLLHHALQPEMEKGLGFLGSVYTNEASWKFMRKKHEESYKKED